MDFVNECFDNLSALLFHLPPHMSPLPRWRPVMMVIFMLHLPISNLVTFSFTTIATMAADGLGIALADVAQIRAGPVDPKGSGCRGPKW